MLLKQLMLYSFLILVSASAHARIGLVIFEVGQSIGAITANSGHSVMYMSGVCADSPVRARLCREGEHGSFVNRYPWISKVKGQEYAWVLAPANTFLYGVDEVKDLPLISGPGLRETLLKDNYRDFFSQSFMVEQEGNTPGGSWRTSFGASFTKNLMMFSIESTPEEDQRLVDALNSFDNYSNTSFILASEHTFNLFLKNCTDFVRKFMNIAVSDKPEQTFKRDWLLGLGMSTPKGLSKQIVDYGKKHPEAKLQVELFTQIPSTIPRSTEVVFPMENSYRNIMFLPWLLYVEPLVPAVSFLWHKVLFPYNYRKQYHKHAPGKISELASQIEKLKQDISSLKKEKADKAEIENLEAELKSTVNELVAVTEAEFGTKNFSKDMAALLVEQVKKFKQQASTPEAWKVFFKDNKAEKYHGRILKYLDQAAKFSGNSKIGGIVEVKLPGETFVRSSSLSLDKTHEGDPALAQLVLIAHMSFTVGTKSELRPPTEWSVQVMNKLKEISENN